MAPLFSCRFYANKSPRQGDIVVVRGERKSEDAYGVYVELLEYDGLEGFVSIREYRIRAWEGHAKTYGTTLLGRVLCAEVLEVNEDIVELSLKRVTKDDERVCRNRYAKMKCVQSIFRRVANRLRLKTKIDFEKLIENCVWSLTPNDSGPSCTAYDLLKKAALGHDGVLDICGKEKDIILEEAEKRLSKKPVDISSTFETTCYRMEGVDAIKRALYAGLACSREDVPLKINLVCSPTYIIKTCALDEALAIETIEKALSSVEESILKSGGDFRRLSKPAVIQSTLEQQDSDEEFVDDSGIGID